MTLLFVAMLFIFFTLRIVRAVRTSNSMHDQFLTTFRIYYDKAVKNIYIVTFVRILSISTCFHLYIEGEGSS